MIKPGRRSREEKWYDLDKKARAINSKKKVIRQKIQDQILEEDAIYQNYDSRTSALDYALTLDEFKDN